MWRIRHWGYAVLSEVAIGRNLYEVVGVDGVRRLQVQDTRFASAFECNITVERSTKLPDGTDQADFASQDLNLRGLGPFNEALKPALSLLPAMRFLEL